MKVIKNYILRIIIILFSKLISIRIKKINLKLVLQKNPKSINSGETKSKQIKSTSIEFLDAQVKNLTLNQIYSKNEKFIFYIRADNCEGKAFNKELFSEKKASIYVINPGKI